VFRRRRKGVEQRPDGDELAAGELADGESAADEAGEYDEYDEYDEADEYGEDDEDDEFADDEQSGEDARPAAAAQADPSLVDLGDPETWTRAQRAATEPVTAGRGQQQDSGPWDGAGTFPDGDRMDFGSLLVPAREGFDIQVNVAEEQGVWVAVVRGDSGLQLQAFAAPKTSGLWAEDRQEIAEQITAAGGESQEAPGPFGVELHARLSPEGPGQRRQRLEPVRFLGVDGPRWFLRGVISGPAARRPELAKPFEEIFADVVVVRGDHPAPPRDLLEIQLPEQAREALEAQLAQDAGLPNPFERGPEITETR
jgi:Protein of unknown function (DUF3710)